MEAVRPEENTANASVNASRKRRRERPEQRGKRVASCGQKARSLQRLLEHKKDLPEEVQVQMRATAEALQKQHRQRVKELKRQRFIRAKKALYSKLKFYELKKVQRRLQQTRKQLLDLMSQQQEQPAAAVKNQKGRKQGTGTSQEIEEKKPLANRIAEAQQKLRLHLDDLNYIRLYPVDEPYVALFPAQDSEESQRKRNAMRLRIRELLLRSRMGEEGNENEEAGGDDMFVDAAEEEQEASAPVDPFEQARALSDEEEETQQGKPRLRPGQKAQGRPRDNRGAARPTQHKGMPPGRGRDQSSNKPNPGKNRTTSQNNPIEKRHKQQSGQHGKERSQQNHNQKHQQKRQHKECDAAAQSTAASKQQPTRIGLSKHKAPNQHLMFDSDDD